MKRNNERGMVLIACMLILALLSLLGAASLLTATTDTQMVGGQRTTFEAFYAAEAALDVGVGRVMDAFQKNLTPFEPGTLATTWHRPNTAEKDPYGDPGATYDFNGFATSFRVRNPLDSKNPGSQANPDIFFTTEGGQQMIHFAYTYQVEAKAEGPRGYATQSETLRVLETPLVQYYLFFDDDLSWHPGPHMQSWGRVHTNGDLYFSPQAGLEFKDTDGVNACPNTMTVHGAIKKDRQLGQANSWPNTTSIARACIGQILVSMDGGTKEITTSIDGTNRETEEPKFKDAGEAYHVRVGVDKLPAASFQTLDRGGFYETAATNPKRTAVDGMTIVPGGTGLKISITLSGGAPLDVTDRIANYEVAAGVPVDFASWPADARTRADGTVETDVTRIAKGSIVYSPEAPVTTRDTGDAGGPYTAQRAAMNPRYPCVLERRDQRDGKEVDLTVVDLQRLELWYRDYLDYRQDLIASNKSNAAAGSLWNPRQRSLLLYVSRSGGGLTGTGTAALQAVKLLGSRAGRTRGVAVDRQSGATLLTRTTVATDNPLYVEGDFNAPGASGGVDFSPDPSSGCALLSDATTLVSNNWGVTAYNQTGGVAATLEAATDTAFNAAFFTGRFNFRKGGAGEEAGLHNFVRFMEDWNPPGGIKPCRISGCLINLWFSRQATGPHGGGYYDAPDRRWGWDVNFGSADYWPPYVPSVFSVERVAWRKD